MRPALFVTAAMMALSACSGSTTPKLPEVVGGFTLVSVNGIIVPGITAQNETVKTEILIGNLGINSDGTFTETRMGRITISGGTPSPVTSTQSGTWTMNGAQLSFVAGTLAAPVNFTGSYSAAVLTYTSGGSTFVYHKVLLD